MPVTSLAEFTLHPADFPLGRVFGTYPEVTLELDRVVPSNDTVLPYFWVHVQGADCTLDGIQQVFDDLPELRSVVLMEDLGDRGLFRAEWEPEHLGLMSAIPATGVTVVSASGSADGWLFELRAEDVHKFAAFQQYCADHDIDVTLRRLGRLSDTTTGTEYNLTPEQQAALVLAYREGYYDDPSSTDQESLAAELGITRQALSSRLRRGYRNLIGSTIVLGSDAGSDHV